MTKQTLESISVNTPRKAHVLSHELCHEVLFGKLKFCPLLEIREDYKPALGNSYTHESFGKLRFYPLLDLRERK